MSRRHLIFACDGETLCASIDQAEKPVGMLIVSGGNETRAGAFNGQARLAATLAARGYPVFRFDRRGVGDSTGANRSFLDSVNDISMALTAFRDAEPGVERIVAFGNCDAASALMLGRGLGCDALVLANPWTFEDNENANEAAPPASAIRARYRQKLTNPREVWRLLSGGVSITKLAAGLARALRPASPPTSLANEMLAGLNAFEGPVRVLIAANDRTGQAFAATCPQVAAETCPGAGHAFAEPDANMWLVSHLVDCLDEQTRQLDMG